MGGNSQRRKHDQVGSDRGGTLRSGGERKESDAQDDPEKRIGKGEKPKGYQRGGEKKILKTETIEASGS